MGKHYVQVIIPPGAFWVSLAKYGRRQQAERDADLYASSWPGRRVRVKGRVPEGTLITMFTKDVDGNLIEAY